MKRTLIILALMAAASTSMTSLCMQDTYDMIPHSVHILNRWRLMNDRKKHLTTACADLNKKKEAVKEGSLARTEIQGTEEMVFRLMMDCSHAEDRFQEICKDGISCETLTSILESMDASHNKKE